MICPSCVTFIGNPCPACRTYTRIGLLLRGRLVPSQESRLLEVLRIAAGGLQDLVETSPRAALGVSTAPPIPGESTEGVPPLKTPEPEAAPGKESIAEDKKEPLNGEAKVHKEGSEKKSKRSHGDKKKRKSPPRKEGTGAEKTPEEAGSSGKEKKTSPEDRRREPRGEDEEERHLPAGGSRASPRGEGVQAHVDRYVAENPSTFGLGSLPVKGSAGRHFLEKAERERVERPPEPLHPPSASRHGSTRGARQPTGRSRSRSKKKKSKGVAHRERGRLWRQHNPSRRQCRRR